MHQLIKVLPKFIHEKIQNELHLLQSSPDDIRKWLGYLEVSKDHFLEEIHQDVLHYKNVDQSKLYIKTQFHSISQLLNELTQKLATAKTNNSDTPHARKFYEHCIHILESIISHIQEYYNPLICNDVTIPITVLTKIKEELASSIALLQNRFFTRKASSLLNIAAAPLKEFMDKQHSTYKQWEYIQLLATELLRIPDDGAMDYTCEIRKVLGTMNYNNPEFMNYMIMNIEEQLAPMIPVQEKLSHLAYLKKNIKQLHPFEHLQFDPNLPSIKSYILQYLDDEIEFLKNQQILPENRPHKTLKWKGPKVGLIELARACKEIGAFDETLQEIYTCFEEFFSIRLDNPSRTFQEILSRKKDESSYLQKLAMKLKEQKDRMIENYNPRK